MCVEEELEKHKEPDQEGEITAEQKSSRFDNLKWGGPCTILTFQCHWAYGGASWTWAVHHPKQPVGKKREL